MKSGSNKEVKRSLNFLQLLEDLVCHIFTKFRGFWICTLGDMIYSLKSIESITKVTIIGLIKSHLDAKVPKLELYL
jgi:hypothetical protein